MDKLKKAAIAFGNLFNKSYEILIGKKGKEVFIPLYFSPIDFHHLMGLGKLKDLRIATMPREKVFSDIIQDKITYEDISKSLYFHQIIDRFAPLSEVEKILDSNEMIFKYVSYKMTGSSIQAEYLLSTAYNNTTTYIFIDEKENRKFFCRSFFPKREKDYTQGQERWTLLYKEKINLDTGEAVVQYKHSTYLTPQEKAIIEQTRKLETPQQAVPPEEQFYDEGYDEWYEQEQTDGIGLC